MSPWAKRLKGLKFAMKCGTRLGILIKLKKDMRMAALYTHPINMGHTRSPFELT